MASMILLKPGKTFDQAIALADELALGGLDLSNTENCIPHIGSASFNQLMLPAVLAYERWTHTTATQLGAVFQEGAVITRLRAEKYWLIIGSQTASAQTASMMYAEFSELRNYYMQVANELRLTKERYTTASRHVLDTNDLLHYYRLDTIPWARLYTGRPRLAISHIVLDEIDSKSYSAGPTIQKRARGVYRLLEGLLDQSEATGHAILPDGTIVEFLAEEGSAPRRPNNDDEIVALAAALQQAIHPGVVTVISRDIGMRARALARSLKVGKIPDKYLIQTEGLSGADLDAALASITPDSSSPEDTSG